MAEKDASVRLRKAVQENNLFLVKRLVKRTDMRNPDPNIKRYTSLAWAAVYGHKETFEYLLSEGHDDDELSKDSEDNTILILLADAQPPITGSFRSGSNDYYSTDAILRMARSYYDKYPNIRDWANSQGKTALHAAAIKGNEELVRMLLDLGADFDLPDNEGNTPLHYASAWGHVRIVQLLIERGCQYSAKNNEGFTASDYAYSTSTRDTLQDAARAQYENNKRARRPGFAQAAARGNEWPSDADLGLPPAYIRQRARGGSGASRTTGTSESDFEGGSLNPGQFASPSSSPSLHPALLPQQTLQTSPGPSSTFHVPSKLPSSNPSSNAVNKLSPIATRMLERDADAMEKYKRRNRSGSAGTTSTDATSYHDSSAKSLNNEETMPGTSYMNGSVAPRRLLRPSASAAQLRTNTPNAINPLSQEMIRTRSGTNPTVARSPTSDTTSFFPGSQNGFSSRPSAILESPSPISGKEDYTGPPELYAQFPPPLPPKGTERKASAGVTTVSSPRRLPFNLLSKPIPSVDPQIVHRRGASTTS